MLQEKHRNGSIVNELLLEMDDYEWSSISEIPTNRANNVSHLKFLDGGRSFGMMPEGQSLRFDARQIIKHSAINLNGSILEFDTGPTSIGVAYPDFVAIDNNPRNVKHLRQKGIRAIIGTIEDLPFPDGSFDYVIAFSPLIIRGARGWNWANGESNTVEVYSSYREVIVNKAIEIARKKVLIASIPIAVDPPFIEKAERIVADPRCHYYYVVYTAG